MYSAKSAGYFIANGYAFSGRCPGERLPAVQPLLYRFVFYLICHDHPDTAFFDRPDLRFIRFAVRDQDVDIFEFTEPVHRLLAQFGMVAEKDGLKRVPQECLFCPGLEFVGVAEAELGIHGIARKKTLS